MSNTTWAAAPRDLGLVFSVGGVGAVAGAFLVGHRGMPRRHISFMYLTWSLTTLAVAGYGLATRIWQLMETIEPVFGQIKELQGARRFLRRGLATCDAEWKLLCGTHNLLKLWRHQATRPSASPATT